MTTQEPDGLILAGVAYDILGASKRLLRPADVGYVLQQDSFATNLYRGYRATYAVENSRLVLSRLFFPRAPTTSRESTTETRAPATFDIDLSYTFSGRLLIGSGSPQLRRLPVGQDVFPGPLDYPNVTELTFENGLLKDVADLNPDRDALLAVSGRVAVQQRAERPGCIDPDKLLDQLERETVALRSAWDNECPQSLGRFSAFERDTGGEITVD